ncbi:uncharacterized protein G2W53_001589 [Senna tora]|uniref:Uncharacterized protein n=1 Tax=Senna tora TaxID=362788 RepID=A0A834XI01_9FABA|nr:uncharacterized protein G2W53_001589 [Senna tora]
MGIGSRNENRTERGEFSYLFMGLNGVRHYLR